MIIQPIDEVLNYIKLRFKVNYGVVYRDDGYIGSLNRHGYRQFKINWDKHDNRVTVVAHHISWFLHKGTWPILDLYHIDRNKENNDINNLREVTASQQSLNRGTKPNKNGHTFVKYKARDKRYEIYMHVAGDKRYITSHKVLEEANKLAQKYKEARDKLAFSDDELGALCTIDLKKLLEGE